MFRRPVGVVLLCLISCVLENRGAGVSGELDIQQLARKHGYRVTEYKVTTEDGYELGLFRIKGRAESKPVLLVHGILNSADTWLLRGNTSLAIALAERGSDVWMPTCRGGPHSRSHAHLPTQSAHYWDFSFHELGVYDLRAVIDAVLSRTGSTKLDAVAHSQGNTIFYALLTTMPEYNAKVDLLVGLAPVAFLSNVRPPLGTLIRHGTLLNELLQKMGVEEMFGEGSWPNALIRAVCSKPRVGYHLCVSKYLFPATGADMEELEPEFLETLVDHFPTSTSRKNLHHFSQVGRRGELARYDYGARGNLDRYGSSTPPAYNLSLVSAKAALLVGANDNVATVADVAVLGARLPNVVQHLVLPRARTNHIDFVWGRNMRQYLFPHVFQLLDRYVYGDRPT